MKVGGVSWNKSTNSKEGVTTKFKCDICGRRYKLEWAKINHEKLCRERFKSEEIDNEL